MCLKVFILVVVSVSIDTLLHTTLHTTHNAVPESLYFCRCHVLRFAFSFNEVFYHADSIRWHLIDFFSLIVSTGFLSNSFIVSTLYFVSVRLVHYILLDPLLLLLFSLFQLWNMHDDLHVVSLQSFGVESQIEIYSFERCIPHRFTVRQWISHISVRCSNESNTFSNNFQMDWLKLHLASTNHLIFELFLLLLPIKVPDTYRYM